MKTKFFLLNGCLASLLLAGCATRCHQCARSRESSTTRVLEGILLTFKANYEDGSPVQNFRAQYSTGLINSQKFFATNGVIKIPMFPVNVKTKVDVFSPGDTNGGFFQFETEEPNGIVQSKEYIFVLKPYRLPATQ